MFIITTINQHHFFMENNMSKPFNFEAKNKAFKGNLCMPKMHEIRLHRTRLGNKIYKNSPQKSPKVF